MNMRFSMLNTHIIFRIFTLKFQLFRRSSFCQEKHAEEITARFQKCNAEERKWFPGDEPSPENEGRAEKKRKIGQTPGASVRFAFSNLFCAPNVSTCLSTNSVSPRHSPATSWC